MASTTNKLTQLPTPSIIIKGSLSAHSYPPFPPMIWGIVYVYVHVSILNQTRTSSYVVGGCVAYCYNQFDNLEKLK